MIDVDAMSVDEQIDYVKKHLRECFKSLYVGRHTASIEAENAVRRMLESDSIVSALSTEFATLDGNLVRFVKDAVEDDSMLFVEYDEETNSYKMTANIDTVTNSYKITANIDTVTGSYKMTAEIEEVND